MVDTFIVRGFVIIVVPIACDELGLIIPGDGPFYLSTACCWKLPYPKGKILGCVIVCCDGAGDGLIEDGGELCPILAYC